MATVCCRFASPAPAARGAPAWTWMSEGSRDRDRARSHRARRQLGSPFRFARARCLAPAWQMPASRGLQGIAPRGRCWRRRRATVETPRRRFAGLAVGRRAARFQLPAVLTTPANRASPSQVPAAPRAVTSTRSQPQRSSSQQATGSRCRRSSFAQVSDAFAQTLARLAKRQRSRWPWRQ